VPVLVTAQYSLIAYSTWTFTSEGQTQIYGCTLCFAQNHFIRHNTPHPKDLRTRHAKFFNKTVAVTSQKSDNFREVCSTHLFRQYFWQYSSHDVCPNFFFCCVFSKSLGDFI